MSPAEFNRRAILAGTASVPALTLPAVAAAAEIRGSDRELRKLWSKYLPLVAADEAVMLKFRPAHAAYEADWQLCPEDATPAERNAAHKCLQRKHGLDELSAKRHSIDAAQRETIASILSTEAEGLFGIAVKLSALPDEANEQDFIEAVAVVLEDIDRLLGSDFAALFGEIHEPDDWNRTWEPDEEEEVRS